MTSKLLTAGLLLLAVLLNGCEGSDPLENTCEAVNVYVNSYDIVSANHHSHHESSDQTVAVTLYRLCDSARTVDLSLPVHKLIWCKEDDRSTNEFFKRNDADRFIANFHESNASNFYPMTIGNVFNTSDEELDRNSCFLTTVTLERHHHETPTHEIEDSFTDAEIVHLDSEERRETVRLRPGRIAELQPGVISEQEMFPLDGDSTLEVRNVTVMTSWFRPERNESVFAVVHRPNMQQYITIFFERPYFGDTRIFRNHVEATLMDSPQTKFGDELVELYPGWIGELGLLGSKQTMIRKTETGMSKREVTVMPKYRSLAEGQGVHAKVNMIYMEQIITIYYRD